jgi:putative hemolysin
MTVVASHRFNMEEKMNRKILFALLIMTGIFISVSCSSFQTRQTPESGLPNPASVNCKQKGGKLELRQDASGGVSGICHFADGSECEEWAYFRSECKPGDSLMTPAPSASPAVFEPTAIATVEIASDGWKIYRNDTLGYSFHYPVDTKIITNDEPLKSMSIIPIAASEIWPSITISHPGNRAEYQPPEGTDLLQWLKDHLLMGETRKPDVQIAGSTAIHFRHERSPQSYAFDSYFFANAGQLYMITIGHTEDKEDWTLYNHFLESFQFDK